MKKYITILEASEYAKVKYKKFLKFIKNGSIAIVDIGGVNMVDMDILVSFIESHPKIICKKCNQEKPSYLFYGYYQKCSECISKDESITYKKRRDNKLAYSKKYRENHKDHRKVWNKENEEFIKQYNVDYSIVRNKNKEWSRKKCLYGITKEQYEKMIEERHGNCDICNNSPKKLFIDHDHKTGVVRGLLCINCNLGIGNLKDNVSILKNAINYLNRQEYI